MKNYPVTFSGALLDIFSWIRFVTEERKNDVNDFNNLNQVFISGRKVGKIPTGASDVNPAKDRVGDFNYTPSYLYILTDNAGTATWRRVALSTF
jgi:hypothetical protein